MIYLADKDEHSISAAIGLISISPAKAAKIKMLGAKGNLKWKREGNGFKVMVPENLRKHPPAKYAWVFKISKLKN